MTLDAQALAVALKVKPARIRQWVHRGHLHPVGRDGRRHLYRVEDVARLLRADPNG